MGCTSAALNAIKRFCPERSQRVWYCRPTIHIRTYRKRSAGTSTNAQFNYGNPLMRCEWHVGSSAHQLCGPLELLIFIHFIYPIRSTFTFGLLQTGHTNSLFKCIHSHLRVHRYFIYGLQDAQHLERVKLDFQMFEIQKGEHKDKDKEYVVTFIHLPQMHLYNILI